MNEHAKQQLWRWLYDNAVTGLAALAFGAWAWNLQSAKDAYIDGQRGTTATLEQVLEHQKYIMEQQAAMQRDIVVIKDRQDRNTRLIDDHESRLRAVERGE